MMVKPSELQKEETSPPLTARSDQSDMKQNEKNPTRFRDEEIIAGFKFTMQYLGCGEGLEFGGSDLEIANVIHDIHALYSERNAKLSKARTVVVFVDAEKINVFNEDEDEILLTFPLAYVKDVTTCLDQAPYSKTSVLVAREYNEPLYKPFVFYSKSTARTAEFYHFTTSAFQLGFKRMENDSLDSGSTADEIGESSSSSTSSTPSVSLRKSNATKIGRPKGNPYDEEDGDFDSVHEFGKSSPESRRLLNAHDECLQMKKKSKAAKSFSESRQSITVRLSNNNGNAKHGVKFNLNIGDQNNNDNAFVDTVGDSSRLFVPNWFRNSYRKFRKMSNQRASRETPEDV
ncbi:uncharacterized protein LOC114515698 isoform X2 [Dendronephthya gigantea]|uniref:uncharacterized protein LOC114515698 isoform X2 n=1 Tax=Dendronephthya gigantea TaxID=151771 RepID=UPI00106C649E|nr:uncharacterized protein LOC114515698 isoform X2 [Dendronephthya gigantea]